MNRLEQELYDINCKIDASIKRENKVISDTVERINKDFETERIQWMKRRQEILRDIRGEQELLNHVYDELE